MYLHEITEETTFKEVLDSFTKMIKDKGVKPDLLTEVKNDVTYSLQGLGVNFDSSNGGAHYGHWWTLSRFTNFKVTIKTKRTGKLIKITKLKSGHKVEFNGFEFNRSEHPDHKTLNDTKVIDYIKYIKRYDHFIIENFFSKVSHNISITDNDFNGLSEALSKVSGEYGIINQLYNYNPFYDFYDHPLIEKIKSCIIENGTIEEFKELLNLK